MVYLGDGAGLWGGEVVERCAYLRGYTWAAAEEEETKCICLHSISIQQAASVYTMPHSAHLCCCISAAVLGMLIGCRLSDVNTSGPDDKSMCKVQ